MANNTSKLVITSRLDAEFLPGCVIHRRRKPGLGHTQLEETWEVEPAIGKGTFGVVRIERRRLSGPSAHQSSTHQLRAVKEISKTVAAGQRWDYMKELEAIVKFSLPRYGPYFVRSHGWFESSESIFITMEYLPLGDLKRFMDSRPRFSEDSTQQIVRQLLKGIQFMHESGFAHRDLKPGNILVASDSPRWAVKIADFGISKQAIEGGTHLQTMHIGTFGYMAPEVHGFHADSGVDVAYSVSVDIWAIGIIAIELLLKLHPLPTLSDLVNLINGSKPLVTDTSNGLFLSVPCRDFVRGLLTTNPITRPTASAALQHVWLEEVIPDSEDEESLFVTDDPLPRFPLSRERDAMTPASLPSLAWSNLQLTNSASATQATNTLLGTYHGPILDSRFLIPSLQNFSLETNKYFILRSDNPIDIESSVAHSVWTSSQRVNRILDKAWKKTDGQVILFFSVIKSQKFCGIAQMTSAMDWENTDEHWLENSWQGRFTLDWLCLTELPFQGVKHIPVSSRTPGFRAIACYDGTEISAPSAFELLKAFSNTERERLSSTITPPATMSYMDTNTLPSSRAPSLLSEPVHGTQPSRSDGMSATENESRLVDTVSQINDMSQKPARTLNKIDHQLSPRIPSRQRNDQHQSHSPLDFNSLLRAHS
ncbi:kinase-like protein [Xylariaceae sp. FL1651]|nr:kinase-like protein [Xylariaceae sp. FL1651]